MPISAAALVFDAFEREAGYHAQALQNLLGYCIANLNAAQATPRQRAELDTLAALLADLREQATPTEWNFSHLSELKNTIVTAAFLRPGNDRPETDNPLYNVLIWLADAVDNAGALARLAVTCESVVGITEA